MITMYFDSDWILENHIDPLVNIVLGGIEDEFRLRNIFKTPTEEDKVKLEVEFEAIKNRPRLNFELTQSISKVIALGFAEVMIEDSILDFIYDNRQTIIDEWRKGYVFKK